MAKRSRTKNTIINTITGFGGQLLAVILQFVVRTVFIYTLGKEYLGINGLFHNILSMLSLAELGIGSAIAFRLYKPLAEHNEKRVRVLIKFYRIAYKVIGALILMLGLMLLPFLPKLIKDYDSLEALGINATFLFLLFLMQSVSSYLFLAYRSTVVTADQKKYVLDLIHYAVRIIQAVGQIIVLVVFHSFIAYTAVAIMGAIANSLISGIIAKKIYPQYFISEADSLSKEEIKEMFQDCGALFIYKANGVIIKATDNLVLSTFIGIAAVGLYSNYLLLYRTFIDLLQRLFGAARASMGNLFATETRDKQYHFFRVMNLLTATLFGTAGVGVAVCGNEVILNWIGTEYIIEQPVPVLIGIELFFAGIVTNLGQVRGVSGVFRQAWYRPLLGIIINIVVSVSLVQVWGIAGVILGTIASYVLTNFLIEPALIYKYTFKGYKPVTDYYKTNVMYILICVAVAAADMWICAHFLTGHGLLSAAVHILITGLSVPATFVLVSWKTKEGVYLRNKTVWLFKKSLSKKK